MGLLHRVHDGFELLGLCLVYGILEILTDHRHIGGHFHHVHAVNLPELLLLCESGTGSAALSLEQVEEILESDRSHGLALTFYLYMLLGLYGLMEPVRIAAARHDAPGELIHNQHLILLHHIVLVTEHQIVGPQGQNDIVLDLQVLRVRKVLYVEEILHLLHAGLGEVDDFVLLIDDEVPCLLLHHAHDGVHLGQLLHVRAPLHPTGQQIAHLIERGGLAAVSGQYQGRPGLIDEHGVHLVDDTEVKPSQHQLLLVDYSVVAQIIETQLIVRHISDIAAVGLLPLLGGHPIENHAHGKPQEFVHLPHPLRVTLHQIVVDRHHMDALALQRVQISRQKEGLGLSFTGAQFGDASLMHDDAANQLHPVMFCLQHPCSGLPHRGVSLHQQIVQGSPFRQPLAELCGLPPELLVGQSLHLGPQLLDFRHQRRDSLQLPLTVRAKYLFNYLHGSPYLSMTVCQNLICYCTRFVQQIQH